MYVEEGFEQILPNINEINTMASNDDWSSILKKVQEGTGDMKDLFVMVDRAGDGNGFINVDEFKELCYRIGYKLSDHRILEIIATVKERKLNLERDVLELNEVEFEQALKHLQEKKSQSALYILKLTNEDLGGILVFTILLFLMILIFIFVGLDAFSIGGTFGSLVNSTVPASKEINRNFVNNVN